MSGNRGVKIAYSRPRVGNRKSVRSSGGEFSNSPHRDRRRKRVPHPKWNAGALQRKRHAAVNPNVPPAVRLMRGPNGDDQAEAVEETGDRETQWRSQKKARAHTARAFLSS